MNYFIIDGLNLAYRAHNAKFDLKTASGDFSGMFYLFIKIIFSLKKKYRGYRFQVAWDRKPLHKYDLQEDYKSGRVKLPKAVTNQIPDIEEFLHSCNIDQFHAEDQEADDVIASLVEKYSAKESDNNCVVYTNDKDMLQLVRDGKVTIFKPKVGLSPEKFYDEEAVYNHFGVKPHLLPYFRSLAGDSSDTLRGINRVPRKKLASMVIKYKNLDTIYNKLDLENLTTKERSHLAEGKDRVFNNLKIIFLNRSLKNIIHDKPEIDKEILNRLIDKYEIKTIDIDSMVDLFSSDLNIRYTDPKPPAELKSLSLFN